MSSCLCRCMSSGPSPIVPVIGFMDHNIYRVILSPVSIYFADKLFIDIHSPVNSCKLKRFLFLFIVILLSVTAQTQSGWKH